jgi:hypothetical protein
VDGRDARTSLDILKTAVTAGSTGDSTWAGPLVNYQILTDEFIEFLRPLTIIGRIPGLTRVPFKVKIPRQTGGATVNWVGEGAPKPLTSLAFDSVTLDFAKIAGIIVLNEELMRWHAVGGAAGPQRSRARRSSSSWMRSSSIRPRRRHRRLAGVDHQRRHADDRDRHHRRGAARRHEDHARRASSPPTCRSPTSSSDVAARRSASR